MRAFATQAAFLDAAEGRDLRRDQAGVDADHARFQRLCNAPDAAEAARIEVGSETERRVVAHRDHLGFVLETEYGRQRTEGFFMRNKCIRLDVGEHRRFEEAAAERMALAAGDDLRTAL